MATFEEARNLGLVARARYRKSGKLEDVEQMVTHFRDALTFCPPNHSLHSSCINDLGNAFKDRYQQLGRLEDLDVAIAHLNEALSLRPPGHPDRSTTLDNLGVVLRNRFAQVGKIEDLEVAIKHLQEALSLCPPGDPDRSYSLINLGNVLNVRYGRLGAITDLHEAVNHHREALSLCPPGHQLRVIVLNNLGNALGDRYEQLGMIGDLDDSITLLHEDLTLSPPGHPHRPLALNNLGIALGNRYKQLGRVVDLNDTITYHLEALTLRPPGHPLRSSSLINIGNALGDRFEQLGRIADLYDSITYRREALSLCLPGHSDRSNILNNLANALRARYVQLGRVEDLENSIINYQEALSLRPRGHPNRSMSLSNLAAALDDRHRQLGRIADLNDSINYYYDARSLRPLGHPDRCVCLMNLGRALRNRYWKSKLGGIQDLKDSVTHLREALGLCLPGHSDRSAILNNLALALSDRYDNQQLSEAADLESSITYHREALSVQSPGHPLHATILSGLADTLLTRYKQSSSPNDIQEFFTLIQQAAGHSASSLQTRLCAAERWATFARFHHDSSLFDAYSTIFHLLNRSLILHPSIDSQHKFLATADISIASTAASAAIQEGKLELALELLEQGRSILWSKMAGYRLPLDELRQADEELADRLQRLSAELENLALFSQSRRLDSDQPKTPTSLDSQTRRLHDLTEEWDQVVALIREKEGFSNFLQAVPFESLRKAAIEGPIVIINVSKYRSDAIILLIDGPPIHVMLPDVQPERLKSLHNQLDAARKGRTSSSPSTAMYSILRKLWKDIVHPVLARLKKLGIPDKSRIWWCPTSELCGLPLHAAGPYLSTDKNLLDLYTSSYIATITALIRARSDISRQSTVPKMLVIGQPETLPQVLPEIENIRQLASDVDVIVGEEASESVILDRLQQHSWAHFACHGSLGKAGPFHASFKLHGDALLSLRNLMQARLPNAELAFLSACHSAAADPSTPNETISLATALQFCGFRSVVGTLWLMDDRIGPAITKEFYKHMFRNREENVDFRDAAEALNVAIRALRKSGISLDRWIMFIHIGA